MKNQQPIFTKRKNMIRFFLFAFLFFPLLAFASTTSGTIDPTHNLAWGENLAWVNFSANNDVTVTDSALTGNIWSQTYGWINLNPTPYGGVVNDGEGNLSGYAWGQNVGWINFSGAKINTSGKFTGIIGDPATTAGRISFDCASCDVETDWRSQSAGAPHGGGPLLTYVPPQAIAPVTTIPAVTPTTPPPVANPTTPPPVNISGCDNRTTGFSITTGQSCVGNTVIIITPATTIITPSTSTTSGPSSYNFGLTTLKNGSKGEAVKELQRFLNRFLNLGLVVDGKLGPKTIAVIKKWQKANGLVADGLVGVKTKAKMNAEVK